jgi:hypothetical protein
MTDAAWKKLIERAIKSRTKTDALIKQAEAEYERRYETNPREVGVDDDWWIDTIETGTGVVDMQKIKAEAHVATHHSRY